MYHNLITIHPIPRDVERITMLSKLTLKVPLSIQRKKKVKNYYKSKMAKKYLKSIL